MKHSSRLRHIAPCLATLLALLVSVTGHTQVANRSPRQVSFSAWIVLATEDFKRGLQTAGGAGKLADEPVTRTLLEQATRSGDAVVVSQPVMVTKERVPAEFGIDLPLTFERTEQGAVTATLEKAVRFDLVFTPQLVTGKDIALSVRITTKFSDPASTGKAQIAVSDARSLRSSFTLSDGQTLTLEGLLNNSESLRLAASQGKRRELLILVAPRILDPDTDR